MEYVSVGQMSEKWGISRARINILLKAGRIPGAFIVGKSWVIPSNAEKPADWRSAPVGKRREPESYRFPVPYNSYYHNFGVYEAMRHHQRGEYEEAEDLLSRLRNKPFDKYYRISILYLSCYNYLYMNEFQKCLASLFELRMLLSEKDAHKKELDFISYELNLRFDSDGIAMGSDLQAGDIYAYSDDSKPYIAMLCLLSQILRNINSNLDVDCSVYELYVDALDETKYSFYIMTSHFHLALLYFRAENEEAVMVHLRKAIDIAVRYGYHCSLALFCFRFGPLFDKVLEGFYPELQKKIHTLARSIQESYTKFFANQEQLHSLSQLTEKDYRYIIYAVRKKTNHEIAELEKISLSAVSQDFSCLCNKLGVKHKSGLIRFYANFFGAE